MNIHRKAKLTPRSRAEMIRRILDFSQPVAKVAKDFGISQRCAYKWLARVRAEGRAGLHDGCSRPICSPRDTTLCGSLASWRCAAASSQASRTCPERSRMGRARRQALQGLRFPPPAPPRQKTRRPRTASAELPLRACAARRTRPLRHQAARPPRWRRGIGEAGG